MREINFHKQLIHCLKLTTGLAFGVVFAELLASSWSMKGMKRSAPVMCPIDAINTGWIVSAPMDKPELQTDYNLQSTVTYNQITESVAGAGKNMKKNMIEPIWDFDRVKNCGCVGYMKYSRSELESCFGTPHNEIEGSEIVDDNKVKYEWWFDIDGEVVTIYDYKEYRDVPEDEPILWHIGGKDFGAVLKVQNCGFEKAVTRPEYVEQIENLYGHIEVRRVV